ncbi:helix-turn-helix transcriptional regulator [Actinomadura sp. NEAU-AAG7]|uniref:helix-turn-helix domain-containing protein n=1 Tax=Actinomadura sp. NEAU-AAG7 TaxID=2839640 RepID=UPI001BE3E4CD|nr:helix-turn-helix transcriptional regulator [Actinomadura sp. NEAU-AAG7]MBT2210327.1 helix-turn-helix domain-containing protein [Actinomadura sp. NEAU-AAG7]
MTTTSPSSSAQQARQALADRLRELRLDAGLTGRALAVAAGWDRTKVSKIEHAARAPNAHDIRTWCRVCGAEEQSGDLIATLRAVEGAFVEWKRLQRSGLRRLQESRATLYERTRVFRVYEPGVVPGLLQTPGYVRAILAKVGSFRDVPTTDLDEAVAARIARQRVLREGAHRFAFLMEESAIWTRLGGTEVAREQLADLQQVMTLPSVSLGIIPADAHRELWPVEGFWMFDRERVTVETVSGWLTITQPAEIVQYEAVFEEFAGLAAYGSAARELLQKAQNHLV